MRYTHFTIENFKGIESVTLRLDRTPRAPVYTLVGLNESGKTTVLEAIHLLTYREELDPLDLPGYAIPDTHDLIPIAKRANFNGKLVIKAGISVSDEDAKALIRHMQLQHKIALNQPPAQIEVSQSYKFQSSRLVDNQPQITWTMPLTGKASGRRKEHSIHGEAYTSATEFLRARLPRIQYFPNFLFEFPDRIYLADVIEEDKERDQFYRAVLQDVLDAIGDGATLAEHVFARAQSGDPRDKRSLDAVLLKMGSHITKTVFSAWDRIFRRSIGKKEIVVDIAKDEEDDYYLHLRLKDGAELYDISERSLGFRWFFTFLLLTQYRGFRKGSAAKVLFLLDEPASNLHPSAQAQLLDSFQNMPPGCEIIYTTHSHHMIKPEWLEGAFVVKNDALDYQSGDEDYNARNTNVSVQRYREFAAQHPSQTTYFQPVLDVLAYSPAKLDLVPDVVMLEGKGDYYVLRYLQRLLDSHQDLKFIPGTGAGSLTDVIRLYAGWGRNFIVLLDSDEKGSKEAANYMARFGTLLNRRVFTLADLVPEVAGESIESLFTEADRLRIQGSAYPGETAYNKIHFHRSIQEAFLTTLSVSLDQSTQSGFKKLLSGLDERLIAARE